MSSDSSFTNEEEERQKGGSGHHALSSEAEQQKLSPTPTERLLPNTGSGSGSGFSNVSTDSARDKPTLLPKSEQQMASSLKNKNLCLKFFHGLKQVCFKKLPLGILFLFALLVIVPMSCVLFPIKNQSGDDTPPPCYAPPCLPDWIWYQGKCYYFSKEERNWNSSQDFCSSHNASLVMITNGEMEFIQLLKGKDTFWIGLTRSPGQPWKWLNGDNAALEVLGDGGECAYLDSEFRASSSRCRTMLQWLCSKPDASKKSNYIRKNVQARAMPNSKT